MPVKKFHALLAASVMFCACNCGTPARQDAPGGDHTPREAAFQNSTRTEDSVPQSLRTIGQRTLDALKNADPNFLASVVDDSIALGTDNPVTSSADFKQELKRRTGAYCDLFGCNGAQNSVRNLLSGKTLAIRALTSNASPGAGQIGVFEVKPGQSSANYSQSPIITLFFVSRNGTWRLVAIEYL